MALTEKEKRELFGNYETAIGQRNAGYSPNYTTLASGAESYNELIRQEEAARKTEYDNRISNAQKFNDLAARYTSLVDRLKNTASRYGADYGKQKSNYRSINQSRNEFSGVSDEIEDMLAEIDASDLDVATKNEFATALIELGKATDSASLDARSRSSAYNNPATQRIMQMEDEQLFTAKQFESYNRALQSLPNRLTTQALTDAPYEYSGLGSSAARAKLELAEMPEGNAKNAVGAWLEGPVGQAISDEAISKEIERLKAIDIDTAISTVQQTIDEKDAKVQTMSKYWDEQAWMNDENAEAPDHEEYQRELAELEKYRLILDQLYADKDAERAGGFRMIDDSIARSHLSENYNATNLYDRVNKAFFDTTVDFGVEYTPPEGVKTSSYPIAQRPENYMTQDERDTFNKLWHYEGEEAANAYFERIKPVLEARGAQQVMAEAKQFTEDYPNWAWAQARGANAMKPISSAFMVGDILNGEGVRENSAANMNTRAANFVDSYVPEVTNYTGNTKFLGRDLDQFLYGTVGSTVDSAVRMMTASFIGGSGAGASLKENAQGIARATGALMSLEVFPSVVLEEKEKGRSDTQAVLLGAVRAAIEGFTEKYSVELLFSPSKTIGGFLLKGAAAEGSEEIAATVLNGVVDIIAADRDNILQEWDRRTALGIDPIEALADILVERGESTLADGMSGALSGLLFSAGGAASGAMTPTTQSAERMAQSAEVTEALVKQALAENPNNRVALKAQEDLAAGKTISAKTVQKLIESNESVYRKDDQQTIASFVASELTNRGEVAAVNETANAIAKAVVGENLSDGDLRAIENSVFGKQLYSEVTGQTQGGEWLNQLRDNLDVVEIARPQIQRETKPTAAKRVTVKNADATTKDGTAVQIVGLEAQTDGTTKVKVKGSDGAVKVMAASELELNEISKDLIEGVAKFKGAAPAIYAAYMPTNDVGTYLNDVEYIVTAANGVAADNNGATILDYLKNSKHISDLADVQIETIFNAALAEGRKALAEAQPLSTSGSGQFTYTAKRAESSLKGREAAATVFMQNLAKAFPSIDIEVFESTARMGKYIGEQGSYSNGKIRIDLNAGKNFTYDVAESAMLRTLSHELTHHLQRTAPKQYADLKAFVIKHLAEWNGGTELDDLISAKHRRSGGKLSYAAALDEVVADSCEMMLKNSAAVKQLAVENKGLFSKIRDFVKKFLSDLRRAFAGVEANDAAARYLQKFETEMQKLWDEAFTASVQNARSVQTEKMGVSVDMETESVTPTVFSERTWHSSDYVQNRDKAAAEIASAIDVSLQQAKDYIDDINSIARMISEDRTRLDYFSSPMRSSFISNAEYGGSFDFSTLCKKRRLLTGTFTAIQKALPNTALTANEILEIRNKMKEAGLEVSCGLCYVEGSRANMGQFAKEFLRLYKQYYPDAWQPNMADVNTPDGIEWVRINHPECYEQYEYFWNHYGTLKAGDKNLFASQQKPKLYQLHTEYNGEILVHFKGDAKIEEKNKNGGVRLQSFSDFEIVHLIDCMQIIMDMSRVGLAGQAYTKVPEFAWALGDTGLKINLSLIAKDVDANGKLVFDDVEGMPINTAMELRNRYSANVGTILVVFNDAQLTAAMADERVDFIIPFHRSQWKKSQYAAMGLPAKTKDYTYQQNEKYIKPQYHEYRGRMVRDKATNYMPNEYWDFSKSGKENAIAYLEMCAANNKRPKFYKLLQNNGDGSYSLKADGTTDGYWKLLIDFKMYDNEGNGSPQMPVQPKFNMEQATKMLNEYKGGHSQFPVAQGIVDEFVSNYKATHGEQKQYSERDIYVQTLTEQDIERYYNTGKTGHVRNKKKRIRDSGGSAVLTSESEVHEFVENSVLFGTTEIKGYGVVPLALSDTILEGTEGRTNTESWFLELSSDDLFHAFREHENAKEDGDLDMSVEEFARIPMSINGKADYLGFERYKDQTKIKLGVRDENGGNFVVVEMVSSGSYALRLKNAWKVTYEKYEALKERKASTEHKWTSKMPAPSNGRGLSDSNIAQSESESQAQKSERDYEAAEIAKLEQRIAALEQGKTDAFLAGEMRTARQEGKETRRLTEKIDTLKGKLEEAKQTAKDTKKASAEERKAANLRAKNLEAQIKKLTRDNEEQISKLKEELADRKATYRESLSTYRENSKKTTVINSIKRLETNLQNQLLGKGGKGAYVPVNLINSAIGVARLLDTSGSPTYTRNGEVRESQTYKKYVSVKEALLDLQDQYNQLPQNPDPEYAQEYTREFASMLAELRNAIGDKNVHDMTLAQLQDVYSILRQLTYTLIDAKKQIGKMDAKTNYEIGTEIMDEMRAVQGKDGSIFRQMGHTMNLNVTSPLRNINRMTGYIENSALVELFSDINDGIKRQNAFRMDANKMFDELRAGDLADVYATACNKLVEFDILDEDGNKVQMTMMQAMQLLLSYEREASNDKLHHLERGGAIIPDHKLLQKGKLADATLKGTVIPTFTPKDAQKIRDAVKAYHDAYGTKFVEVSRQFFNSLAKDAINDTTMITHHRPVATDKNYIPFSVDQGTVSKELEGLKYDSTIEGSGILKSVKQQASNPLVIVGLNHVIDRHIEDVARIYGLSIPIRNFNKVWNVKMIGSNMTTKKAVGSAWGAEGQKMIEQTITDLQTSREKPSDIVSKALNAMQSNFVKATLLSNISVTIKQAASYSVAGLHLSQRALAPYQTTVVRLFAAPEGKFAQDLFDEIDTYTPEHWIRRQGMSTQELGDLAQRQGKLVELERQIPTALNPVKWIQNMDVATTAALWLACKKQVQLDGNAKVGTDAYWTAVTELYERVIEETQPMYDVLHRPEVQKTTNALVRNVVMFKTQPLQNSGVLFDTYGEMVAARKGNDKGRAKAATQKFGRAVFSQVASLAVFSTMSLLAYAVKHKIGRYRDDDDELTAGSVLWRMVQDMMSSAAGLLLPVGGTELYDFIDRRIGGSSFGDSISVPTVQILNEFLDASGKMIDVFTKEDAEGWENALWEFAERTAAITAGLPIQNVANIIDGIRLSIKDIQKGVFPVFNNTNVDRENSTNYDRLWNAIVDGDAAKYGEVYDEVYTNLTTKDEKTARDARADIASGITERVKEAFYAGEIDEAAASKYLSEYGGKNSDEIGSMILKWKLKVETGMDYDDLSDEFVRGEISADEFKNFLMNYGGAKEEDADATVQRALMEKEVGIAYDDMKGEYLDGKLSDADVRNYLAKYGGKSETAIDKTLSEWSFEKTHDIAYGDMKQAFLDGEISRSEAVVYRMEYGGAKEADAEATVTAWEFEKKYGYAYDDMRSEFVAGRLSEENAIAYRMEYGGQTEKEASKTVAEWKLEKEAGVEYDDLKQAFLDGDVTDEDVITYRTTYGGQTTKEAEATLAEWKFEQATGLPQSELKGAFVDGEFTADEATDMLVDYAGKSRKDAEADVAKWQMEVDTGYAYADMRSLYLEGDITKNDVISYQQKYGGKTSEAAQETANEYEFEKTYGWAYGDKATLYKGGDITSSELRSALINYGGMTSEEADLQIKVYDLEEQGYTNVTAARIKDYDEFCASSGVPYQTYFDLCKTQSNTENDKDENGDTINYSAVQKVMAAINATTLTSEQKTAVALSFWKSSTVNKYKVW